MLTLILLTFLVFVVLWVSDLYLTLKVVKKVGVKAEANPLLRKVLSFRGRFSWAFKGIELLLFLYLIYYLSTFGTLPFYILLGYIFFYAILVANNSRVYFQVTKKSSPAFRYTFLIISLLLIMFIYLNFLFYSGLTLTFDELRTCQSEYKNVYRECYEEDISPQTSQELKDILETIDIKIPMP